MPFDLVLLDLMMPRLSGYEVLTRLRAAERTAHVPVIMISALDEMDSIVRCIEAGAEDYLPKPWNPVILQARVNACIEKKQLRDRDRDRLVQIEEAHRKSESLLLNILPNQVVHRLHRGEAVIADRYDDVTILFSDVVGFTRFSAGLSAPRVVEALNGLFSAFDRIAHELGIEKIKTVGDAYMAVAGLPEPCPDHAAAGGDHGAAHAACGRTRRRQAGQKACSSASGSTPGRWWPASSARTNSPMTCGAMR